MLALRLYPGSVLSGWCGDDRGACFLITGTRTVATTSTKTVVLLRKVKIQPESTNSTDGTTLRRTLLLYAVVVDDDGDDSGSGRSTLPGG